MTANALHARISSLESQCGHWSEVGTITRTDIAHDPTSSVYDASKLIFVITTHPLYDRLDLAGGRFNELLEAVVIVRQRLTSRIEKHYWIHRPRLRTDAPAGLSFRAPDP